MYAICRKLALDESGEPVIKLTLGKEYEFTKSYDPIGWEVEDDDGNTEVFFNTDICFTPLRHEESSSR